MSRRAPEWFEARAMAAGEVLENPSGLSGVQIDGGYVCSGCARRGEHACQEVEFSLVTHMAGVCTCELCVPEHRRPPGAASVLRREDLSSRYRLTQNRVAAELSDCMVAVARELRTVVVELHTEGKGTHGTRSRLRRLAADLERKADATK